MKTKNRLAQGALVLLCSLFILSGAPAAPPPADTGLKDTEALRDLKVAKGVFMLDVKDPARMAHVLKVIEETQEGIARQNVKPELVVVVIGSSVAFLTRDRRGISYLDQRPVAEIQSAIGKLKALGIRTEACGIAMKGMDILPEALIPDVTPVGDGYISAIGYQAQGFRLVPVY